LNADNAANKLNPGSVPQSTIDADTAAVTAAQQAVSNAVSSQVSAAQAKLDTLNAQLSGTSTQSSITDSRTSCH